MNKNKKNTHNLYVYFLLPLVPGFIGNIAIGSGFHWQYCQWLWIYLTVFVIGFGNLADYLQEEMNILNKDFSKKENGTKYGEFISSFFSWIGLKEQKKRTEELENITNKRNKK